MLPTFPVTPTHPKTPTTSQQAGTITDPDGVTYQWEITVYDRNGIPHGTAEIRHPSMALTATFDQDGEHRELINLNDPATHNGTATYAMAHLLNRLMDHLINYRQYTPICEDGVFFTNPN